MHVPIRLIACALAIAPVIMAQSLSFTASPNPGSSPLTTTITWTTTNIPGELPHYVRITGQGFDSNVDLSTSGSGSATFYNGTASATQSSYSATLWRFDLDEDEQPTVRTDTGISANLQITINPDSASTITASVTSFEAPVTTVITWSCPDYGPNFTYNVSGFGFVGSEEVARTGSRTVYLPGQPGQNKVHTFTLQVFKKYPNPDYGVYPSGVYRVVGTNAGPVYGTDEYLTAGTNVGGAAVHAGLLVAGQIKNLMISYHEPPFTTFPPKYVVGSTRNGITSTTQDARFIPTFTMAIGPVGSPEPAYVTRTVSITAIDRPTAPTGLNYAEKTATSITLIWNPSRDQASVIGYNIYRRGPLSTDIPVLITGSPVSDIVYTDFGLTASTLYSYTVKAISLGGNLSLTSGELPVTTTQDFSIDTDHDGIPDATEIAAGSSVSVAATAATTAQTQQNIHRPLK